MRLAPYLPGLETAVVWVVLAAAALATGLAAARLRWLTASGAVAAVAVGTMVLLGTGAGGVLLLLLFFFTSSVLTTLCRRPRSGEETDTHARGRSAAQVLANGGVAGVAAVSGLVGWLPDAVYVMAGSLAAATADTWATELGTRIGAPTRLITTWRAVPPGLSGGVSWPGTVAAAAGAALIGAAAAALFTPIGHWTWLTVGTAGGVIGMIADSFAGAGLEGRRPWIDNNVVNGICTVTGGVAGWAIGRLLIG